MIADQVSIVGFKASHGHARGFLKRHDICNIFMHGQAVTAGHPAPTLGEPVPPSQRGTRGFASGAIGSSQSETVTGSREGNMSY